MDKPLTFVGIDVSKHRLDIHLRPSGEGFTVDHGEEEVAALVARLVALAPALAPSSWRALGCAQAGEPAIGPG